MMKQNLMKIGEVADRANVNIQTVRYYERRNLLKPEDRLDSGYRLYSENAVRTILFIKHAQDLGFKLDEIRDLLNLRAPSISRCERVSQKATIKLKDVREKISLLKQIESTLLRLIRDCESNRATRECPIINSMEYKSE